MLSLSLAAAAVAGYLAGAVPFGVVVARGFYGVDPRRAGSGNIGATNVFRLLGPIPGVAVLALDFAKGFFPALAARRLAAPSGAEAAALAAGLAAVIGHVFPLTLGFRGGKGVATGAGALAALAPAPTAIAALVWGLVLATTRYVSLASISAAVALPAAIAALEGRAALAPGRRSLLAVATLAATLVIARHRTNLRRIFAGNEPRVGRRKEGGEPPKVTVGP
jgi:glycerol-3-phosphate acyltransferase PlsY